jgi:uncharacterized membrane protein
VYPDGSEGGAERAPHPSPQPPGHSGHGGHGGHSGHGGHGGHSHGPAAPASRKLRRIIAAVLLPFAASVLVAMALLWPDGVSAKGRTGLGFDQDTLDGTVTKVVRKSCRSLNVQIGGAGPGGGPSTPDDRSGKNSGSMPGGKLAERCSLATVRIDSGSTAGAIFRQAVPPDQSLQVEAGDEVVVSYTPKAPKESRYTISDLKRGPPMALLAGLFAFAVVLVGRLRGLAALVSLGISFAVLALFVLPAVLQGENPLLVAVVGGSAIMLVALYLCHGFTARTSVAALGTLASLCLIALLGGIFTDLTGLTGNTSDETGLIHSLYPGIEMQGLLLAGILIGALGVLDDVTVTQTSAVWELHQADPSQGARRLYAAAMRIGRDHIASTVNTLVLAYAGAALPIMLLFSVADAGTLSIATSEIVAEEIVRTLVGSIGLVASVPLTTALAALVASRERPGPAAGTGSAGRGRRRKRGAH